MLVSVLGGAKPAEMPMEQPTEYKLAFYQKTARALGIKIPQAVLIRADRLVE